MRSGPVVSRGVGLLALVAVAASLVVSLLWAPAADAHAVVVSTSPPAGSTLTTAPAEVTITFSEPVRVDAGSIVVVDADGAVVSGPTESQGTTVRTTLEASITGWHAVSWRAISADGHPVSGAWTFRVGEGSEEAPEGLEATAAAAVSPSVAARWGFYAAQWVSTLAAAVLVGSLFCAAVVVTAPVVHRLATAAGLVALVSSFLAAAANGPYATAGGALLDGPASVEYLIRAGACGLAVALAVTLGGVRAGRILALVSAMGALAAPVAAGHAASDGAAATLAVMAHLVVAGCWLGAIPAMVLVVRNSGERGRHLRSFSRAATWMLVGTLGAGLVGMQVLTGGLTNATQAWGWALFAKLALIGVAVAAGAWNRWNVVPRADSIDRAEATIALRVEVLALAAVIAASLALTHNGPPALAVSGGGPAIVDELIADDLRVQLVIDPARVGTNDLHLYLLDAAGLATEVEEVTVSLRADAAGVASIDQPLSALGAGHYTTRTGDLGLAGTWTVEVVVRPDPFSQAELVAEVDIAP